MDYRPLIDHWQQGELAPWAALLEEQIATGLSLKRYGDLPRWLEVLASLPDLPASTRHLDTSRVGADCDPPLDPQQRDALRDKLQGLHPWRKGPFELFGVHIDTEWRSDWKWDRIAPHIDDLGGRRILDVGCGSGYHCWRMAGAGATEVIGIDPTPLFVVQFWALQKYLQQTGVWVLPLGIEHVPPRLKAFDTVFSMGVLYHRRSPMDHLQELRDCLRPGGQLVLETLVIEGGPGATLVPEGRYARMGNVWFLPSVDTLLSWLRKTGFSEPALVDVSVTSTEEQRTTEWMRFHSLENFLDPENSARTIEGYPAPCRAVITAKVPG
ncbi:tRNA 5-methoxyuridine(34)/uridine 5-oxyacetic acid(34) synthase CmoB [Parahaliea maris]|uniref:tRNA U34 carboxymethyltransferase n=1 Tax=Parahaliea maris TaxID=2716870 RepID=A0A5C8ZP98_9GAMM|nr:tRNA 5-methoxyuridine(34)/uridine 5-oxyacetic acid(34) synthase CmoB [Parahaliea maris]TXS89540.1 tRNA 5-methoxyuridine(34)/uridine 5-oxyacetic acid(34) synthase CmoB [Parahaliea maris]